MQVKIKLDDSLSLRACKKIDPLIFKEVGPAFILLREHVKNISEYCKLVQEELLKRGINKTKGEIFDMMFDERRRIDESKLRKNGEGYNDPTAYRAIKNLENDDNSDYERFNKLLHAIRDVCELSDFDILERIVLKDKKTGRVWR